MRREGTASRLIRLTLLALVLLLVGYLVLLARRPAANQSLPAWLRWFGDDSAAPWTIAVVVVLIAALCVLSYRARRSAGMPIAIVVGLFVLSLVLALASFWGCHDPAHPSFFTPLAWSLSVVQGGVDDKLLNGQSCTLASPEALDVARFAAIAGIFLSIVGAAVALLQSRFDRVRARFARSVIAVVGVDDDAQSMVTAIARTLAKRSRLVLITDAPDRPCVYKSRNEGALVVAIDGKDPDSLSSLRLWREVDRLYLLAADPMLNLQRLAIISRRLEKVGRKERLPLIVRIDDPWQAEAWRAQRFGGSDTRWAADAVGMYEVTARRLLDHVVDAESVQRVIICGTSQLTLALCADIARRKRERDYYTEPAQRELPGVTLVGVDADEYRRDHEFHQQQLGVAPANVSITVVAEPPSIATLARLITEQDGAESRSTALIFVDTKSDTSADATMGTRLASRFPQLTVYAWDPQAQVTEERSPIVGRLRTYRLAMDLPEGHAQDIWERAAMLIHERYAAGAGGTSPASQPWAKLNEFYRGSNRRLVANALWMVEKIGGHTWNTWGSSADAAVPLQPRGAEPLEQLQSMGIGRDDAMAMAKAEHEAWCGYLRENGWTQGGQRDDQRKIHDALVDWSAIAPDSELFEMTLKRLVAIVMLRSMGIDRDAAMAMAQAEHDDWCRYYRRNGWRHGERDDERKLHPSLIAWSVIQASPALLNRALSSLATTLMQLRQLGYRSRPLWDTFKRSGTVTAEQRDTPWTWTADSGETMHAEAGDWAVTDGVGGSWSVRDDIFRSTYQKISENAFRRTGLVLARQARAGEVVETLEGKITAANGDWVLKGQRGDTWTMRDDQFARRYEGPVDGAASPNHDHDGDER
jgi:hypothetical protein